ncbi:MAG: alanine racemase [Microbacteriaceae bacterium]
MTSCAPMHEAIVDLDAYRHNVSRLARLVAPAELMVMVKANAYGHGLLPIALAAVECGIRRIGVLDVETGLALRRAGVGREVTLFAWLLAPDENYREAIEAGVDLGISQVEQLHAIAACGASEPARLHLKIDTGLHRNGATEQEWPGLVQAALAMQDAGTGELYAIWTHISEASDEDDTQAIRRFDAAIALAERLGARPKLRHLAASAAGFSRADCRFDLVRMGAFGYGISPGDGISPAELGLIPALTLTAQVSTVIRRDGRNLAVVPIGHADGVPAGAGGKLSVTIHGTVYPIVGQVQADYFVIDLGADAASVRAGAVVVLYGRGDRGEFTLQQWADTLDTIGEEIVVRLPPTVPRRYLGTSGSVRHSD